VKDVELELALAVVPGRAGHLFVSAQRAGHHHPEPVRATVAHRTFAVMYLANFSLNNLSLMALTIATGFVVDDAIVMIEKHLTLHRVGGTAARGRAQRRRQIVSP